MVVHGGSLKRVLKRRVTADLGDFLTFPASVDQEPPTYGSSFRTAVRQFLAKNAILPPPSSLFPHLLAWQVLFRIGDLVGSNGAPAVVQLDIVEEDVSRSRSVYCDQCRVVGWSNNPVCAKRYHFIIKADGNSIAGYKKACAGCGESLYLTDSRCKSCNHMMTTEDVEDWMYNQLESTTHLLHGVIHANGFGHLLRVNGIEGGSEILSGRHIMNFWDRLCRILAVRNVSVMDVSKKHGLDFRLLHAVIVGHSWYGDWGYKFGAGSYSLTLQDYKLAISTLSSLPLSVFRSQGRKPRMGLQDVIAFYQSISESELVNIRDLFSFLVNLIHDVRQTVRKAEEYPCKKLKSSNSVAPRSWTIAEIRRVEEAMFKVLRAVSESTWVSWRALRGAVCKVGPPELLDHCLKELKGKQAAPGMVVGARSGNNSGILEYRLEPGFPSVNANSVSISKYLSEECLLRDLKYLYESMLHPETMVTHLSPAKRSAASASASKILDCKKFVKNYDTEETLSCPKPNIIQLFCQVELIEHTHEHLPDPPSELILLDSDATITDLKREVSRAFQDVYLMFKRFQADEIVGFSDVNESSQIKLLLGPVDLVKVRGRFIGKNGSSRFRVERGMERWTVNCCCGAKDDDGERMLACDGCGVWQHTRCWGIPDSDAVPARFSCEGCKSITPLQEHVNCI